MNTILNALIKNLVYPLALNLVGYLYDKYIESKIEDEYDEREKARNAMIKAISKATTNEERKQLSIALSTFNKLSDS